MRLNDDHTESQIFQALRDLPRETASPGFTATVMRRIRGREDGRAARQLAPSPARWLVPAGAAFLLFAMLLGYREHVEDRERRVALAEIAEIRAEKAALEAEIEALRRQYVAETQQIMHVGRVGDVELVVDLDQLARHAALEGQAGSVRPVTRPARPGDGIVDRAVYAW